MTIETSENDLIDIMKKIPSHLELSSLPKILGDKRKVVISLAGYDKDEVDTNIFELFIKFLEENKKRVYFKRY